MTKKFSELRGSLPNQVDPIDAANKKITEIISFARDRRRNGIIEGVNRIDHFVMLGLFGWEVKYIVEILADLYVDATKNDPRNKRAIAFFKKRKDLYDKVDIKEAINEIDKIYTEIKAVGLSRKEIDHEKKWRNAALARFDDTKKEWKYIKRKFLDNHSLYSLNGGQEKRDFQARLLQKISEDQGVPSFGINRMNRIIKKSKK